MNRRTDKRVLSGEIQTESAREINIASSLARGPSSINRSGLNWTVIHQIGQIRLEKCGEWYMQRHKIQQWLQATQSARDKSRGIIRDPAIDGIERNTHIHLAC